MSISRCTRTRSWHCWAATAPASQPYWKTLVGIAPASARIDQTLRQRAIGNSSAQNARLGIGYVPQGRGSVRGMSVEQNLELGGLKRQTGNGVHWTREASTNISRGFESGSTAQRIIFRAATADVAVAPRAFGRRTGIAAR